MRLSSLSDPLFFAHSTLSRTPRKCAAPGRAPFQCSCSRVAKILDPHGFADSSRTTARFFSKCAIPIQTRDPLQNLLLFPCPSQNHLRTGNMYPRGSLRLTQKLPSMHFHFRPRTTSYYPFDLWMQAGPRMNFARLCFRTETFFHSTFSTRGPLSRHPEA
jgi:hypothetical protein